jgi:glyoxylase-like metal-dependent hydrolase (beta-lactamase superfamily II)
MIKTHMLSLGAIQTNCFIVADTDSKEAVIIDPSGNAPTILEVIEDEGYTVRYILLTHAHWDHVLASRPVKEATGAPLYLHENEIGHLTNAQSIANSFGVEAPDPPAEHDHTLSEGDVFEVGAMRFETLFTPGHSPGHVTFVLRSEGLVFSGDCLFAGGIGRTDFPGCSYEVLRDSIVEKILPLGDDFRVCPGHGPTTTIGQEKATNQFIRRWLSQ